MTELQQLKSLLLGDEQQSIQRLEKHVLESHTRAEDVAEVIAEAILIRSKAGDQLAQALQAPVEESIARSIQRDPRPFTDALFPIIGPAIRKSVAATLREFMRTMNQMIEYNSSSQGLKWRWESLRTGVPFSEIMLRHTLIYRVEEALLIHRDSGLLVQRVSSVAGNDQDSDAISAMLTAIQDFARDSFARTGSGDLETIDMGEHTLWVCYGPAAMLACVLRGAPPAEVRQEFKVTLEQVHSDFGTGLRQFNGEPGEFLGLEDQLRRCLRSESSLPAHHPKEGAAVPKPVIAGAMILSVLLGWWLWHSVLEHRQLESLRQALVDAPGIAVLSIDNEQTPIEVSLLRDPLAVDPATLANEMNYASDAIVFRSQPYYALDPEFILSRATRTLTPPPDATLELDGETLRVRGSAPLGWIDRVRDSAPAIAGVTALDLTGLAPDHTELLARARSLLGGTPDINMNLVDGVLKLQGQAPLDWIEALPERLSDLSEVRTIDSDQLQATPESVVQHVRDALQAPDSIEILLEGKVVKLQGTAPIKWLTNSRIDELPIRGSVWPIAAEAVVATEKLARDALETRLNQQVLYFEAALTLTESSRADLRMLQHDLAELVRLSAALSDPVTVTLIGHSDGTGTPASNHKLRRNRAQYVLDSLVEGGIARHQLSARAAKAPPDNSEDPSNRRVTLNIEPRQP